MGEGVREGWDRKKNKNSKMWKGGKVKKENGEENGQ